MICCIIWYIVASFFDQPVYCRLSKLNRDKTKEIFFTKKRMPPPPCPGIERVTSLRILGVIVSDRMTAADHVTMLLSSCSSLLYPMLL